jgi:hypothetical protein
MYDHLVESTVGGSGFVTIMERCGKGLTIPVEDIKALIIDRNIIKFYIVDQKPIPFTFISSENARIFLRRLHDAEFVKEATND